jgi:hypothetical protein
MSAVLDGAEAEVSPQKETFQENFCHSRPRKPCALQTKGEILKALAAQQVGQVSASTAS